MEGYNESDERRYVTYLDADSLYATAQSEPLSVGNYRFLDETEIENFSLDRIAADASIGYIIVIWLIQIIYSMHTMTIRWLMSISG